MSIHERLEDLVARMEMQGFTVTEVHLGKKEYADFMSEADGKEVRELTPEMHEEIAGEGGSFVTVTQKDGEENCFELVARANGLPDISPLAEDAE